MNSLKGRISRMFGLIPSTTSNIYFNFDENYDYYDLDFLAPKRKNTEGENSPSYVRPVTFTTRDDNTCYISVEMPGVSRSDIEVDVTGRILTVSGKREMENGNKNYRQAWNLHESVLSEDISCVYECGILKIELPLRRDMKRKIEVR